MVETVRINEYAWTEIPLSFGVVCLYSMEYMMYSNEIPADIRRRDFRYRIENGLLNGREIGYGKTNEREKR